MEGLYGEDATLDGSAAPFPFPSSHLFPPWLTPRPRSEVIRTAPSVEPSPYQTFLSTQQQQGYDQTQKMQGDDDPAPPPVLQSTRFWSDFNRVEYHPRSMNQLPSIFRKDKDASGFGEGVNSWSDGLDAWKAMSSSVSGLSPSSTCA